MWFQNYVKELKKKAYIKEVWSFSLSVSLCWKSVVVKQILDKSVLITVL